MKFILDENVSICASKMLQAFDRSNEIHSLLEYYPKGTKDPEWIPGLSAWNPQPIVISGDAHILSNRREWELVRKARIMWVLLGSAWIHAGWDIFAWKIIKAWPAIRDTVNAAANRPAVFEVGFRTTAVTKRCDF